MTRPLLLSTRPADEAARCRAAANRVGFDLLSAPLLRIVPLPARIPDGNFDALLFTSPRAPHPTVALAPELRRLPVICVGPRTAEVARAAGFDVLLTGDSDGNAVLRQAAQHGLRQLLQLCGQDRIQLAVPKGMSLSYEAVYAARAADGFDAGAMAALREGRIFAILLFSPRTARIFARIVDQQAIRRDRLRLIALSGNVEVAAGPGWQKVAIAEAPTLAKALDAAVALCKAVAS